MVYQLTKICLFLAKTSLIWRLIFSSMVYFPFLQPLFMEDLSVQDIFPKFLSVPSFIYSFIKMAGNYCVR